MKKNRNMRRAEIDAIAVAAVCAIGGLLAMWCIFGPRVWSILVGMILGFIFGLIFHAVFLDEVHTTVSQGPPPPVFQPYEPAPPTIVTPPPSYPSPDYGLARSPPSPVYPSSLPEGRPPAPIQQVPTVVYQQVTIISLVQIEVYEDDQPYG